GGARPWLGALLLAYYDPGGRLVYAGRVGTGIGQAELGRLWRRLQPLVTSEMPLQVAPPLTNRFGSPLVLSRVHWVRPELVVEVKYLTWTGENLLRQVVYEVLREDRDPTDVQCPVPNQPLSAHGNSSGAIVAIRRGREVRLGVSRRVYCYETLAKARGDGGGTTSSKGHRCETSSQLPRSWA